MARKRMFSDTITDSDAFLEMPLSTQALYFQLSMRADDDGVVNNPKRIMRMLGASDDDLRILNSKKFIIKFDSGIIIIKHWLINNTIKKDRYKPTIYQREFSMLGMKPSKSYTLNFDDPQTRPIQIGTKLEPNWNQTGTILEPNCIQCNDEKIENPLSCANNEPTESLENTDGSILEPNWNQTGTILEPQVRLGKVSKDINNINSLVRLGIEVAEPNTNDQTEPNESEILLNCQIKWNKLQDIGIEPIRPLKAKSQRANKLMAVTNEYGFDSFDDVIQKIRESDWLTGSKDGSSWKVDFDWVTDPKHYSLILDGYYRDYNPFPNVRPKRKANTFNQMQRNSGESITELEEKLIDN